MAKLLYFILCLFLLSSCVGRKTQTKGEQIIKVEQVSSYQQDATLTLPGKIKAGDNVNLSFRVGGTLEEIAVSKGQFVKKGDLLVQMNPRDYEIQFAATQAEYTQIKNEVERVIELYEKESVSKSDYEKAVYGLKQLESKYNAHKNSVEDTRLIAPYDGYVKDIMNSANETVGAGMPVISLINSSLIEVAIHIPASDFVRRNEFEHFEAIIDVYPGIKFPLSLINISRSANLNGLYEVRLQLIAEEGIELPAVGMTTMVTVDLKECDKLLYSVPTTAIKTVNGKTYVWIYNSGESVVNLRNVDVIEITRGGLAIIDKGVKEGESIVVAGVNSLAERQSVKLLPKKSKTNIGGML